MTDSIIELRLKAIESAIMVLSGAIAANDGPVSKDLHNQIKKLRQSLAEANTPEEEALTYQTIRLIDPLNCDPWDPF
nr:hypothetical protein [Pantoea cypripedii]